MDTQNVDNDIMLMMMKEMLFKDYEDEVNKEDVADDVVDDTRNDSNEKMMKKRSRSQVTYNV